MFYFPIKSKWAIAPICEYNISYPDFWNIPWGRHAIGCYKFKVHSSIVFSFFLLHIHLIMYVLKKLISSCPGNGICCIIFKIPLLNLSPIRIIVVIVSKIVWYPISHSLSTCTSYKSCSNCLIDKICTIRPCFTLKIRKNFCKITIFIIVISRIFHSPTRIVLTFIIGVG